MSLRLKIILALTLIGMAATAAIGVVTYTNTRHQLLSAVERSLNDAAQSMRDRPALADPDRDGDGTVKPGSAGVSGVDRPRSFEQVLVQTLDAKGAIVVEEEEGAFAAAVLRVLQSRELRAQLSAVAPQDAQAWSAIGMAQRLLQFYASLLTGSPL